MVSQTPPPPPPPPPEAGAGRNDRRYDGALVLANGSIYRGHLFGAPPAPDNGPPSGALGEVVFQTGMVGYCESLTDPSYHRQILVLTYPLIGNYGVPSDGAPFESDRIWPVGLICGELSGQYSHWAASRSLNTWMQQHNRPGLQGVDTRQLTKELRSHGTIVGKIVRLEQANDDQPEMAQEERLEMEARELAKYRPQTFNMVAEVSPRTVRVSNEQGFPRILLVDCGAKNNIERCLVKRGVQVIRVPWDYDLLGNVHTFDGLMLSNGPGDPQRCDRLIGQLGRLFRADDFRKPVFGICLGHQLMGLAAGFKTYKLPYGNRGHNLPCRLAGTERCLITSQNHGFALDLGRQRCRRGRVLSFAGDNDDNDDSNGDNDSHDDDDDDDSDDSDNSDKLDATHDNDQWFELFYNQNDSSNEGIAHRSKPFFSVQFHPEHNAGPTDSEFLFDVFVESVTHYLEGNGMVAGSGGAGSRPSSSAGPSPTHGPNAKSSTPASTSSSAGPYNQVDEIRRHLCSAQAPAPEGIQKVLILGSGGLSIGQAGEFDYSGSQAIKALKSEKIFTILINPNIATVQTSPTLVDRVYLLPVTSHYVTEVIKRERPDGLMLMFGGQTALNCGIELEEGGVLRDYNVQVLGPSIASIKQAEDRKLFCEMMTRIGVQVAPSSAVSDVGAAVEAANSSLGYPILVRAAYALGGLGSGFAHDERQLRELVAKALVHSPQVLLDRSLKGWKELEYEVVRDRFDNCATVCNMENVDPLGIHTGESIVVAPSQTLNDYEYNVLREVAIKVVRHLGIIGECNVQYAVNPRTSEFYVIEINPRLSRSSALASKATGYPLAYVAAKLALGKSLPELANTVTSTKLHKTTACFEPSLDYCVVKIPRWDLSKFAGVTHEIGSSMKSIGEVMAIGRSFEEAFQKALRMVNDSVNGFDADEKNLSPLLKGRRLSSPNADAQPRLQLTPAERETIKNQLRVPTDKRIFVLAAAMEANFGLEELYELTAIDPWFLHKMRNIIDLKRQLQAIKLPELDLSSQTFGQILQRAKRMGFSDRQISCQVGGNELMIRKARCDFHNLMPFVKQVDTVSAEWPASTNYLYLTYNAIASDLSLADTTCRRFTTRTQSLSAQSQSPSPVKPSSGGGGGGSGGSGGGGTLLSGGQPPPLGKLSERGLLAAKNLTASRQAAAAEKAALQSSSSLLATSPGKRPPSSSLLERPLTPTLGGYKVSGGWFEHQSTSEQVMVLGSGVYRIGSSVEFDCCAVGCVQELRRMGKQVIMLNYNPETVSTDFDECEKLYFDEISFEVVMDIYNLEQPLGIVLSMGGQTPNNIALQLHNQKAHILGTSPESIDSAEDRFKFSRLLDTYNISQPVWKKLTHLKDAFEFCAKVEYPCIVRPSYVLSGAAMNVAQTDKDLEKFLSQASEVSTKHPVVISKFILDAKEIDIDAVAQNGQLVCMAVSEHVENAGVHSGDATLVTPPQDLNAETLARMKHICSQIAIALEVNGPFNMQLIAKDNQLKVIECNLRVSRSFPFVSKTLNYDFIAVATKVIMGEEVKPIEVTFGQLQPRLNYTPMAQRTKRVGVKVPQFSFSRLSGADIKLGVEMASTGEVACFGDNRFSAYLKAMASTGFRLPERKIVLISIGSIRQKKEFLPSVVTLARMGYKIYATQGTADYYDTKLSAQLKAAQIDFQLFWIDWPFGEVGSKVATQDEIDAIGAYLTAKEFDLVINLPLHSAGARRVSTLGYRTRRFAVDHSVPLISDIKCAKLLIEALNLFEGKLPLVNDLDCLTTSNIITLPGLIDVHVHAREPGATHKEDFASCTAAALAGGVTFIGVMPNTTPPIVDAKSLKLEQELARKARCDYGLIVGATSSNADHLAALAHSGEPLLALKMYLNTTFGTLCMANMADWQEHFRLWPEQVPICVHAEGRTAAAAILFAQKYNKRLHVCHVSSEEEILLIKQAKSLGLRVTCEVAPHHLFLTEADFGAEPNGARGRATVRPPLMSARDQAALWDNMDVIDCFATDHAPHLLAEKLAAANGNSPPGFPGLETMLPLLLDATQPTREPKRRLTIQQIVDRLYTNPRRIFNIPAQPDTYIEVDMSREWILGRASEQPLFSKSQWTPFAERRVRGKLMKVTFRGQVAFVDGKLLAREGSGGDLMGARDPFEAHEPAGAQASCAGEMAGAAAAASNAAAAAAASNAAAAVAAAAAAAKAVAAAVDATSGAGPGAGPAPAGQGQVSAQEVAAGLVEQTMLAGAGDAAAALGLVAGSDGDASSPAKSALALGQPALAYDHSLRGQHVTTIEMFDRNLLRSLFNLAERYLKCDRNNRPIEPVLAGKVMATVFFEASTRTEWSFAAAMMRLGGGEKRFQEAQSSFKKGETIEDTIKILAGYCHVIVLRHPEPGAVDRAAQVCERPILNAGDGTGEHPTQALLDVFTIRKEIGTISNLIITLVGDLKHGRTVHSLAKLLCNYDVAELRLVSPKGLELPDEVLLYLENKGVRYSLHNALEPVVRDSDVIYMTRIQRERFESDEHYQRCAGQLKITTLLMTKAKERMIVMHPLPRVDEISTDFDDDSRAAYFRQAEYGLYVRMALLTMVVA